MVTLSDDKLCCLFGFNGVSVVIKVIDFRIVTAARGFFVYFFICFIQRYKGTNGRSETSLRSCGRGNGTV